MKQRELKPCAICRRGVVHNGVPVFVRFELESFILNPPAIQRQKGLELFMGNGVLAAVMGPDEDMAISTGKKEEGLLCFDCAAETPMADVMRRIGEAKKVEETTAPAGSDNTAP